MISLHITPLTSNFPSRHDHYRVVWILGGSGVFRIDLGGSHLEPNTIYFIPPTRYGQLHLESPVTGWVLSFSTDFLSLAIDAPGRPFFQQIRTDLNSVQSKRLGPEIQPLKKILDEMIQELSTYRFDRPELLSGYFRLFLVYLRQLSKQEKDPLSDCSKMQLFKNFYSKLDQQFIHRRQVADYASELSVSPSYLTEVIKQVTGYTASYHIQQRMVQEAKRLAMYSDSTMKDVAYTLGFVDTSHFSKFFKHAAGMNFSDFKKSPFCAR